jgi:hypothetical protein
MDDAANPRETISHGSELIDLSVIHVIHYVSDFN